MCISANNTVCAQDLKPALEALRADGKIAEGKWLTEQEWKICREIEEVLEPLGMCQRDLGEIRWLVVHINLLKTSFPSSQSACTHDWLMRSIIVGYHWRG